VKFEIDLNDHNQLLKAESELAALLDTVRYAIGKQNKSVAPPLRTTESQSANGAVAQETEADRRVTAFIGQHQERRFTSADIYVALESQISRGEIRGALYRLMTINPPKINLIQAGAGRRPSTYEKAE
jgi:hypothetical protein